MSRQVDVKALVSHIIRGDGEDKCRICMGDTSDGQVYLGDTVMLDGEKPVTLCEVVESITGVEVQLDGDLPPGLCSSCLASALAAGNFRTLCRQSTNRWTTVVDLLQTLPEDSFGDSSICVVLEENEITISRIDPSTKIINESGREEDFDIEPTQERVRRIEKIHKVKRIKAEPMARKARPKLEKVYINCPDCRKEFALPKDLYEHLIDSTDLQRACFICASIMNHQELVEHLTNTHNRQVYDCKKCSSILMSLKQYKLHLEKFHTFGDYSCGECGRRFITKNAFNGHTSMHVVKNCPSCDKLFRNHRCYVYHVKNCCNLDLSGDNTYRTKSRLLFEVKNTANKKIKVGARGSTDSECICDYCNKKFASKKFVCAHIQIVHLKNTHQPCPYCGKSLAAAHMSQHMKSHEKLEVFPCEHCGSTMKSKLGFIQHLRLHSGEKPYACQLCPETFSASSRRSEHIRKCHKSKDEIVLKHACDLCPARFRLPFSLKKHITTVHDKRSQGKVFECPDCHIKFSSCRGMLYHRRKHDKDKIADVNCKSDVLSGMEVEIGYEIL